MSIDWVFPPFNGGIEQGFGHSGIQYFEGNHATWVAREAIQNSLDAKFSGTGSSSPIIVEFELTHIEVSEIPGIKKLKEVFKFCRERVIEIGGDTPEEKEKPSSAINFFNRAIEISGKIPVLVIRDFNTTGLAGDDFSRNSQWYRLIRSSGVNKFINDGAGSHGIGKFAPFAASFLRLVFYSTVSDSGEKAFIGKSILTSFNNGKDECDATGFYCLQKKDENGRTQVAGIRDSGNIPSFFNRSEQGTSLYIIGYRHETDWEKGLIDSVLKNYYAAIHRKKLIIKFKDSTRSHEINDQNIRKIMEENKNSALPFYLSISDQSSYKKFNAKLPIIGECSLYVLRGSDPDLYTKEVVLMRKNLMEVERLSKRVLKIPFAAVFICENPEGNKILRELEPPEHNKWDKDRRPDGSQIIKNMDDWIKEKLKELRENPGGREIELASLSKYLPGGLKSKTGHINPETGDKQKKGDIDTGGNIKGSYEEKPKALNFDGSAEAPIIYIPAIEESGDEPGGTGSGNAGGGGSGKRGNRGKRNKKHPDYKFSFRWIPLKSNEAMLIIHPHQKINTPVDAYLAAAGEDEVYKLNILSARYSDDKPAAFSGSAIKQIPLEENKPCRIIIEISGSAHIAVGVKLI